ncbi:MAG: hypothetical protein ACK47B_26960 [Armatimonadota bacterium]
MSASDQPTQHFQQMAALAEALQSLRAEISEHHYHGETSGSWWVLVRYQGVRMQLAFDGRDSLLTLRCSASRMRPDDWGPGVWTKLHREAMFPVSEIVRAIQEAVAGQHDR